MHIGHIVSFTQQQFVAKTTFFGREGCAGVNEEHQVIEVPCQFPYQLLLQKVSYCLYTIDMWHSCNLIRCWRLLCFILSLAYLYIQNSIAVGGFIKYNTIINVSGVIVETHVVPLLCGLFTVCFNVQTDVLPTTMQHSLNSSRRMHSRLQHKHFCYWRTHRERLQCISDRQSCNQT